MNTIRFLFPLIVILASTADAQINPSGTGRPRPKPGYLGAALSDLTPEKATALGRSGSGGVLIAQVVPGAPAAKAGFQVDDVILTFQSRKPEDSNQLVSWVGATAPGTAAAFEIYRKGERRTLTVTLGERPVNLIAGLPDYPMLRIETGMRSAMIIRIAVDQAQRILATASNDKTVRLWDLASGELRRTLRMPSDEGNLGKAYAVALSPDGRTVAVGGWTGSQDWTDKNPIYLYDTATGGLAARLGGLPNVINHLAFSPDGRYLAACLGVGTGLRIYRTDGGPQRTRLAFEDTAYGAASYGADWTGPAKESPGRGWQLATTCYDGQVRLYDVPSPPDDPAPSAARPLSPRLQVAAPHGKTPHACVFRPDGEALALGYHGTTRVSVLKARDLSLDHEPDTTGISNGDLCSVAWSRDGERLLTAGRYEEMPGNLPIVVWEEGGRGARSSWAGSPQTVMQLLALDQGRTVIGAADPLWAVLDSTGKRLPLPDDPQQPLERRARQADFRAAYRGRFHLSADGTLLEFGTEVFGKNPTAFSLRDFRLSAPGAEPGKDLRPPRTEGDGLEVKGWEAPLSPTCNSRPLELEANEFSFSLAITPDGRSFVLGTSFWLRAYDREGDLLWKQPVPGVAWAVNVSGDGRFVVAAYQDGTIRWHSMADKGRTLLSLFLHRNQDDTGWEWICWSPDGFYQASANGDALIGWQVNRGLDQNPNFYSAAQLFSVFRDGQGILPRVIAEGRPAGEIVRDLVAKGEMKQPLTLEQALYGVPEVEFVGLPDDVTEAATEWLEVTVQARPTQPDVGVTAIRLYHGGKLLPESGPLQIRNGIPTQKFSVRLTRGRNELTADAVSANYVTSSIARKVAVFRGAKATSDLWVLGVGLEEYENPSYHLRFCRDDVTQTAESLKQGGQSIFAEEHAVFLSDKDATRVAIEKTFAELASKIAPGDTFVFLYAGHGTMSEEGEGRPAMFHLVPWNVTALVGDRGKEQLIDRAISAPRLTELLQGIPALKQLVVLDACHAGAMTDWARGAQEDKAIEQLARSTGSAILASSSADQYSRGHDKLAHGFFSYALLEGLREGKADMNKDKTITLKELDAYLFDRVPALTLEHDKPPQYPRSIVRGTDYPLVIAP